MSYSFPNRPKDVCNNQPCNGADHILVDVNRVERPFGDNNLNDFKKSGKANGAQPRQPFAIPQRPAEKRQFP